MPLHVVLPPLRVRWRRAAWLAVAALVASTSLAGCSLLAPKPPGAPAPPVIQTPPGGAEVPPPVEPVQPAVAAPIASAAPVRPPVKHKPIRHRPKRKYKHHAAPEPIAPPPPPTPTPLIETRQLSPDQAEELLETEIQKPAGKVIGRVVDVLVDANARPQSIVVNLTGFLGVGDRQIKFPWSVFRFNPAAKKPLITLLATPAEVAAANGSKGAKPGPGAPPAAPPLTAPLSDATIVRRDGSTVGHVVDVLVDGAAQPQAVVLDVGASINDDTPNIAANWSALHLVEKDKTLQLQMELSVAQIKASPPYTSGRPILIVSPVAPSLPTEPVTAVAATAVPAHATEPVPAASHAAAPAAASALSTPAHATVAAPTSAPAHASAPKSTPEPVRASGPASTPPVAHAPPPAPPPATATATPAHPPAAASSPVISR